jgi:hypothetical protein
MREDLGGLRVTNVARLLAPRLTGFVAPLERDQIEPDLFRAARDMGLPREAREANKRTRESFGEKWLHCFARLFKTAAQTEQGSWRAPGQLEHFTIPTTDRSEPPDACVPNAVNIF